MNNEERIRNVSFDEVFKEGHCNREEELFQYFQGLLSKTAIDEFEKHLSNCNRCGFILAGLEETNEANGIILDSSKAESLFQQNRLKLQAYLKKRYPGRVSAPVAKENVGGFFQTFSIPKYANALMILLLAFLIYPSYRGIVLNKEVTNLKNELKAEKSRNVVPSGSIAEQKQAYEKQIQDLKEEQSHLLEPSISPSAVYPVRAERSGESQAIPVLFGKDHPNFNLVFSVPASEFKDYLVEIYQADQNIWQSNFQPLVSPDSPSSLISVQLHSAYFQKGNYNLRISGVGVKGKTVLAEYKLAVSNTD
jgi:hypothetical protein